jgi:hypothetical protein
MLGGMGELSFLTNHARVLRFLAGDPTARLRDIASVLGMTERRAFGIVNDLSEAGYLIKGTDGRRNRYAIQPQQPLRESIAREWTVGEVLELFVGADTGKQVQPPRCSR